MHSCPLKQKIGSFLLIYGRIINTPELLYNSLGIKDLMIPEAYQKPIIGLMLGAALWITSLYQLEICIIWVSQGKFTFEFPLFLFTTSVWMARDIWYLVNGISLVLASYSGAVFNGKRMMLKHEKLLRSETG